MLSCSRTNSAETTVTLRKGVALVASKDIPGDKVSPAVSVKKESDSYIFTVTAFFTGDIDLPWLTLTQDNKATLVMTPKKSPSGFNASSETARTLTIKVTDRLSARDTVYVLNNHEVIGHVVLP